MSCPENDLCGKVKVRPLSEVSSGKSGIMENVELGVLKVRENCETANVLSIHSQSELRFLLRTADSHTELSG